MGLMSVQAWMGEGLDYRHCCESPFFGTHDAPHRAEPNVAGWSRRSCMDESGQPGVELCASMTVPLARAGTFSWRSASRGTAWRGASQRIVCASLACATAPVAEGDESSDPVLNSDRLQCALDVHRIKLQEAIVIEH